MPKSKHVVVAPSMGEQASWLSSWCPPVLGNTLDLVLKKKKKDKKKKCCEKFRSGKRCGSCPMKGCA